MIDVHCHLNFHAFDKDLNETIKRASDAGVKHIINVGTSIQTSRKAIELAQKYDNLFAIVGIHPHHADKLESGWEKEIESLARNKKVLAIGEIGLDYYNYKSNGIVEPSIQKKIFETQIEIAHRLGLPLQIHNRQAGEDVIEILKHHKNLLRKTPGMFHCFAATKNVLNEVLSLGFYVGFDGNITYEGLAPGESVELKELAKFTPIGRIVTETDSPFLTPEPHRGSRNEPSYVIIVGRILAQIKDVPFEEFRAKSVDNAKTVFNF